MNENTDVRDAVLQRTVPTVLVPKFSPFEPLASNGHRFLVTASGLWLEVRRPWLYLRKRVAKTDGVAIPYGDVTEDVRFAFQIPRKLFSDFVEVARQRLPNECAAWITWSEATGELNLRHLPETEVSMANVRNTLPALPEGEHLVVDLHSHGRIGAYFSPEDNADDHGALKIAGVLGHVDKEDPSVAFRLMAYGHVTPIKFDKGCGPFLSQR